MRPEKRMLLEAILVIGATLVFLNVYGIVSRVLSVVAGATLLLLITELIYYARYRLDVFSDPL